MAGQHRYHPIGCTKDVFDLLFITPLNHYIINLYGLLKHHKTSVLMQSNKLQGVYGNALGSHAVVYCFTRRFFCHHTAEIRTVSTGKQKRLRRFSTSWIHSSSDSVALIYYVV